MGRHWPVVRAILVALHVASMVILSLPSGRALLNRRMWETPNAKAEFLNWTNRLRKVGFDLTPDELEAEVWAFDQRYSRVRDAVATPFAAYARLCGTRQGWQMFATPQKVPAELHVDLRVDGKWRPLARPRDPALTWLRPQLTHNRVRKQLGRFARTYYAEQYDGIANWIAKEAARDFPEATMLRVRLWRYPSLLPDEVLAGKEQKGRYEKRRLYELDTLR